MSRLISSLLISLCAAMIPGSAQNFDITRYPTPIHNGLLGANQGIVASSFRKNGTLDLAMVTNGSPSRLQVVTVLKGRPDGTFEPGVQYDVGHSSTMIVQGDFDGDGKTDLAVPNFSGGVVSPPVNGDISVLLGNGDSTFQAERRVTTTLPFPVPNVQANPMWLGAADFNGDGKTDLVVPFANGNQLSVLIANPGSPNLFSVGYSTNLPQLPTWAGTGDFDEDGKPDFAVVMGNFAAGTGTVGVWINGGSGATFTPKGPNNLNEGGYPNWGLIKDLDGDGHLDIAVASQATGTISILWGTGNGSFEGPYVIGVRDVPLGLEAADFDGDGITDLAFGTSPPISTSGWAVGILRGTGGRIFLLPGVFFDGGPNPGLMAVGDFNNDGRMDLAVTNAPNKTSSTSADASILMAKAPGSGPGAFYGSLAQVAVEGGWDTLFTAVSNSLGMNTAHIDFFGNGGNPQAFPLTILPTSGSPPAPSAATFLETSLSSGASVVYDGTGPGTATATGWARELATGNIGVFGIFRYPPSQWEAVVPLEIRNAPAYYLAFDESAPLGTGVALANVSDQAASIPVIVRDDAGTTITSTSIPLPGHGHTSFTLQQQFPGVINKRGTVEFDTPAGGQISALGLRANGPALTTLPVLANVNTRGGSITHVTYNGGFISIFYIVNTGAGPAPFTLNFSDENGNPLTVPMLLPQTGTNVTASTLTRMLAAKAILVVQTVSQSGLSPVAGSAQLTTTGNITAFEMFQWTTFGQEASVTVETRKPNAFVLVFDNTSEPNTTIRLTTGIALANVTDKDVSITARLFDESGNPMDVGIIVLPPYGHTSFMLPQKFSTVDNMRGTMQLVVKTGQISAIGLRATALGTLTTIPVFEK